MASEAQRALSAIETFEGMRSAGSTNARGASTLSMGACQAPYSMRRGYEPPECTGRLKRWKADALLIPGSTRIGRWVVVPRVAFAPWIASQGAAPVASGEPEA